MTQPVDVWPNPDVNATVTLASGYVITAAGAEADGEQEEIQTLLRKQKLVDFDPSGLHPNPSPIPPIVSGVGLVFATAAQMAAYPAIVPNQTAELLGYYTSGDGGGGSFCLDYGSAATTDNGLIFASGLGLGKWHRIRERSTDVNLKWFGAKGDGTTDDTAAVQAALNALGPFGFGQMCIAPAGSYRITARLKMGRNYAGAGPNGISPWGNVRLEGVGGTGQGIPAVTFLWDGPTTEGGYPSSMFQMSGFDCVVSRICFQVAGNRKVGTFINAGYFPGETVLGTTGHHIEECVFNSGSVPVTPDPSNGVALNGISIDYYNLATGNGENMQVRKCTFARIQDAALWLRGGQPFNIQVKDCYVNNYGLSTLGGNSPYGTAFMISTPYAQLDIDNTSVHRCSAIVAFAAAPSSVTVRNMESEWCKKLFHFPASGYGSSTVVQFIGGRYATEAVATGLTSQSSPTSPVDVAFGPTEGRYIYSHSDCSMSLVGCQFVNGYSYDPYFSITVTSEDLSIVGCVFPTNRVMAPRVGAWDPAAPGRTYSKGNKGRAPDGTFINLPTLNGPSNPGGTVTITGAATTADVVFALAEPSVTPFGATTVPPHYSVVLSVVSRTAAAVVTQPYVTTDLVTPGGPGHTGFQIKLPSAPGGTESVTIAYDLVSV